MNAIGCVQHVVPTFCSLCRMFTTRDDKSITRQVWRRPSSPCFTFSRQTRSNHGLIRKPELLCPRRAFPGQPSSSLSGTADISFIRRRARGSGVRTSQSVGSHTLKSYPSTFRSCLEPPSTPSAVKRRQLSSASLFLGPLASFRIGASAAPSFAPGHWPTWSLAFNLPRNLADSSSKHQARYRPRFEPVYYSLSR